MPKTSFHEYSRLPDLTPYQSIAYVTDAGTPGISDPGAKFVAFAREHGWNVVSVPGPSALTSLISISGIDISEFTFLGFPPHKKGRETFFRKVASEVLRDLNPKSGGQPVIFYEAPTRMLKALAFLDKFCPDKKITIGRELTKKFEEVLIGTPSELLNFFSTHPDKLRGEFVIMVTQ